MRWRRDPCPDGAYGAQNPRFADSVRNDEASYGLLRRLRPAAIVGFGGFDLGGSLMGLGGNGAGGYGAAFGLGMTVLMLEAERPVQKAMQARARVIENSISVPESTTTTR